jgi:hypothetical protein
MVSKTYQYKYVMKCFSPRRRTWTNPNKNHGFFRALIASIAFFPRALPATVLHNPENVARHPKSEKPRSPSHTKFQIAVSETVVSSFIPYCFYSSCTTMNSNMQSDTQRSLQQNGGGLLQFNAMSAMPSLKQQKAIPRFSPIGDATPMPMMSNNLGFSSTHLPFSMGDHPTRASPILKDGEKRGRDIEEDVLKLHQQQNQQPLKKQRSSAEQDIGAPIFTTTLDIHPDPDNDESAPAPVSASKEGMNYFADNDVLSGRGGGTNVHPGNRNFRDLINLHRRAYLKARKNDKPAISRAIVRAIRETTGKFLRKDDKSGLWFEIGDDAAREKTSQALRQRAPEMRKLLFDTEREEARASAEEHIRQQRMFMSGATHAGVGVGVGMSNNNMNNMQNMNSMMHDRAMNNANNNQGGMGVGDLNSNQGMMNPALLQAMNANKNAHNSQQQNNNDFTQMFSAALLQNGMNRFSTN